MRTLYSIGRWRTTGLVAVAATLGAGCAPGESADGAEPPGQRAAASDPAADRASAHATGDGAVSREPEPGERHFTSLRQLTFEGENAEAYFSDDGTRLIFQRRVEGDIECDQIFTMRLDGTDLRRVSTGEGATTCGYFFPSGDRILYASTHHASPECPSPPDYSRGYVWSLHDYDIYTARPDGSELEALFRSPRYDAEATIAPDGSRIVFTSLRDGDLDIYSMRPDGSDVRRLTHEVGYDGGPFFSPDGSMIVYRAHHPESAEEVRDYRELLADDLVRPGVLDIWVMNADGTGKRRLTDNGAANFAPFFHPGGGRVIFASNLHDPDSRNFDLYTIGVDGEGLERITTSGEFDSFPMFSPDGRYLAFASNRHAAREGETNIFLAEWTDEPDAR